MLLDFTLYFVLPAHNFSNMFYILRFILVSFALFPHLLRSSENNIQQSINRLWLTIQLIEQDTQLDSSNPRGIAPKCVAVLRLAAVIESASNTCSGP